MTEIEPIALFDMDGTLCDYDTGLFEALEKIRAPNEPVYHSVRDAPDHIKRRADLIRSSSSWWENLPPFKLGWDVLHMAEQTGFNIMILTQGPRRNPESWSGKKKWIDKYLGPDMDVTITRDKGLVYGKVLVDDYPEYAERWLAWRDRGLVIMPANSSNEGYEHPQVIRYDGSNKEKIRDVLRLVKHRKRGEEIDFLGDTPPEYQVF
jgi:hypothetical protein